MKKADIAQKLAEEVEEKGTFTEESMESYVKGMLSSLGGEEVELRKAPRLEKYKPTDALYTVKEFRELKTGDVVWVRYQRDSEPEPRIDGAEFIMKSPDPAGSEDWLLSDGSVFVTDVSLEGKSPEDTVEEYDGKGVLRIYKAESL